MSYVESTKTALVVSAHSADFVWRCAGAMALYARRGYKVTVLCLSYGERGESAKLWREKGMTLERVKKNRHEEAQKAAEILGARLVTFDAGDYPMKLTDAHFERMVDLYRELRPEFVLTHSMEDPYNRDHPDVARFAQETRISAQAHGFKPETRIIGAPPMFLFEPHQPEQCRWLPQVFLPIDEVWELKRKAMECMAAQEHLWEYYTRVALQRGVQASRNSDGKIKYAEAYQRIFPQVTDALA